MPMQPTDLTVSRSERGQSLMEFAFSVVIALILLAGIVDLSRAFFTQMALRDAAQEGAVYGSICPNGNAFVNASHQGRIEQRVRSTSSMPVDFNDTTHVQVTCYYLFDQNNDGDANDLGEEILGCDGDPSPVNGDGIKVRVSYDDFRITMPFLGTLLGTQSLNFHAEAIDTILRESCP